MVAAGQRAVAGGGGRAAAADGVAAVTVMTFRRLEAVSFTHSAIYLGLLVCAFSAGKPELLTFILGLAHGLLWIGMSIACVMAARAGVIPFWLAVTVAVFGGLGPSAGWSGFVVADRRTGQRG